VESDVDAKAEINKAAARRLLRPLVGVVAACVEKDGWILLYQAIAMKAAEGARWWCT